MLRMPYLECLQVFIVHAQVHDVEEHRGNRGLALQKCVAKSEQESKDKLSPRAHPHCAQGAHGTGT